MKLLLHLITISLVSFLSCNTTEPDDDFKPGRRDYVWTVDTLDAPYDTYYRMWASSPSDIWLTSPGDWDKSIAHFDGNKWSLFGIPEIIVPRSVYGFSTNKILISAENGKIWWFDGTSWKVFAEVKMLGATWVAMDNIWGESANEFYTFGAFPDEDLYYNNGFIVQFKNNKWTVINDETLIGQGTVGNFFKNRPDGKVYLRTLQWNKGITFDSTMIFEYENGVYKKIYSGIFDIESEAYISLINGEVYFVLGRKIAKRISNEFKVVLNVENPMFFHNIWGRGSKDIFLRMRDGLVHYNGSDMVYLLNFDKPKTQIFGASLFDKEAFFLVYETSTNLNLIYKGKLK